MLNLCNLTRPFLTEMDFSDMERISFRLGILVGFDWGCKRLKSFPFAQVEHLPFECSSWKGYVQVVPSLNLS